MIKIEQSMQTDKYHVCLYIGGQYDMDVVSPFDSFTEAFNYCRKTGISAKFDRLLAFQNGLS